MLAPMMNPYLPRPPSNNNSGAIIVIAIIFVLFLIGTGFTVWYVTSTTPSPTSGNRRRDGGDSPPTPPPPPPPKPTPTLPPHRPGSYVHPQGRLSDKQLEQMYENIFAQNGHKSETCDSNAKPLKACSSFDITNVYAPPLANIKSMIPQDYVQFCQYDLEKGREGGSQICAKTCKLCSQYCPYKGTDSGKCCSDKKYKIDCSQSESKCQCPPGQTWNCATGKCVPSCTCENGTPATGSECGDVPYGTIKCKSCNTGYGGSSTGCFKYTCGDAGPDNWQTDCPTGWSCCGVIGSLNNKCCASGCSHGFDTCKDDSKGEKSPQDAPGWNQKQ
tara:strand:+ start:77 stop:1066 length:990 start_codon:yes stop_codon:yes gene_type:complete